ncbi:MAG: glycosyltransferase family 2 protein [Burkholderiales bacterium]|nr:glycosyltransferase family 2 protein [Burkholderiales bacterium]
MPRFSATVVTYHPDRALLERALRSLCVAIDEARRAGAVSAAHVFVVDNGDASSARDAHSAASAFQVADAPVEVLQGHGNVGYGRANNLALPRLESDYHLVMNPDVELDPDALVAAIRALEGDARIGLVAPDVRGAGGERQYLCKRYPSLWILFLRGFAPTALRQRFSGELARYEMRDVLGGEPYAPVPLASGCFMVVRTALFRRLGGFDPRFFMYFEDYDLSLRVGREAQVAFIPASRIVHHGGEAARKGPRHVSWFLKSAWRFFATHGWRIA